MVRAIHALGTASYASVLASALLTVACFDPQTVDPGKPPRPSTRVETDADGSVQKGPNEDLGIYGFWYSYGDQYDEPSRCTVYGQHTQDTGTHEIGQCSFVAWPDALPSLHFPNLGGKMCTAGNGAAVTKCASCPDGTVCACSSNDSPDADYSNMWGTGIGLDFGLNAQEFGERNVDDRNPWNAVEHRTVGVSFDVTWIDTTFPTPRVRVEFPIVLPPAGLKIYRDALLRDGSVIKDTDMLPDGTTSDDHPSGSPYVDAPSKWGSSPADPSSIKEGHNEILWSRVKAPPETDYVFDPDTMQILGIQLHVPTVKDNRSPYAFCIENFAFLRE